MYKIHKNEYQEFFNFLFKKPIHAYSETDLVISNNSKVDYKNGRIYYNSDIEKALRTEAFKRLNKIFQLGTEIFINPNLMHTRAEHSKGTYMKTLDLLITICKNKDIKNIIEINNYEKYLSAELMRALLHDIGHGPFSHTMETICNLPKGFHEEIGNRIIEEDSELRETLNNISPGLSKDIKTVKERNFLGLNYLFEGQFDVDRSDFIIRDSFFADKKYEYLSQLVTQILGNVQIKKVSVDGKYKLVPVFPYEQLENIEKFLECRFYNYKDIYYCKNGKLYEYIFKEFGETLIKSDENYRLKDFLIHNMNKTPEQIDLKEYLKYNDKEFFKGIMEVYKNTKNDRLKRLAKYCLPNRSMAKALYYGLMISTEETDEYGRVKISKEDREFINQVKNIEESETTEAVRRDFEVEQYDSKQELHNILEQIKSTLNIKEEELSEYGILFDVSKNSLYKDKPGEEIYIYDENGKVNTFDKHPNRKVPLMTFENAIIIIEKPQLMEKVKDKEKLQEVLLLTQKQKSK